MNFLKQFVKIDANGGVQAGIAQYFLGHQRVAAAWRQQQYIFARLRVLRHACSAIKGSLPPR